MKRVKQDNLLEVFHGSTQFHFDHDCQLFFSPAVATVFNVL